MSQARYQNRDAKLAVRKAKFQQLRKDINNLQKSVKQVKVPPSVLADKLMTHPQGDGKYPPLPFGS